MEPVNTAPLHDYRRKLEQLRGRQDHLTEAIQKSQKLAAGLRQEIIETEQAQVIIQEIAERTQKEIQFHIEEIVTTALEAVFDNPYSFRMDWSIKRGKVECAFYLERDGKRYTPLSSVGGGVIDVASFALRIAMWSLQRPRSRPVIILDEPFRFLSRDLQPRAASIVKTLSDRLGIQFIIVTHSPFFEQAAGSGDKIFQFTEEGVIEK